MNNQLKNISVKLTLIILFVIGGFSMAIAQAGNNDPVPEGLLNEIRVLENLISQEGGVLGFSLKCVSGNNTDYGINSNHKLTPASILKLWVTGTAGLVFKPGHTLKTTLAYSGDYNQATGVLNGDLIIIGQGDPTLGSTKIEGSQGIKDLMDEWTKAVSSMGITQITGNIIGDGSYYSDNLVSSDWDFGDMGNYYAAPATGLSIHDNLYRIYFESHSPGTQTKIIKTEPQIQNLRLHNQVIAGNYKSSDNAYVHGMPFTSNQFAIGSIPPDRSSFPIKAAIPDPAIFAAGTLYKYLTGSGILISGKPQSRYSDEKTGTGNEISIWEGISPGMEMIIKRVNLRSDNLYAEHLVKQLGIAGLNDGSAEKGLEVIKGHLQLAGIKRNSYHLSDGSGLSSENKITTASMVHWLDYLFHQEGFEKFKETLAVNGETGTLKNLNKGQVVEGRIFGKSGAIKWVRSYTGYYYPPSGNVYAFCIIANQFNGSSYGMRLKLEKILNMFYLLD